VVRPRQGGRASSRAAIRSASLALLKTSSGLRRASRTIRQPPDEDAIPPGAGCAYRGTPQ
jgi:hypothetical protein